MKEKFDAHFTPDWVINLMIKDLPYYDNFYEPFAGKGGNY